MGKTVPCAGVFKGGSKAVRLESRGFPLSKEFVVDEIQMLAVERR